MKRAVASTVIGFALTLALGLAAPVSAAVGSISGTVVERESGNAVAGAMIYLFPSGDSVRTDASGRFEFPSVAPGVYMLETSHAAFEPMMLNNQEVVAGQELRCTIRINRRNGVKDLDTTAREEVKKVLGYLDQIRVTAEPAEREAQSSGQNADEGASSPQTFSPAALGLDRKSRSGHPKEVPSPMPKYVPPSDDYCDDLPPFDMYFRNYGTNRFVDTRRDNLSTFAADVDDASYTLVRRYLQDGNVPPRDAVRIEEFVNHFDYNYEQPSYSKFRVVTDAIRSPFDDSTTILSIGIKGREIDRRERKPLNLTFVIDVSGSMGYDNRLELVKYALHELVSQLGREDRIGIVTYGSGASRVLDPIPADRKREIMNRIDRLRPGGSTNAEAGLTLGYAMAQRQYVPGHNNHIILCSDGVANVGLTRAEDLMETIQSCARDGITLHSFGVGMGNYNDVLLEKLAQQGNGRYSYINNRSEAYEQMVTEFVSNMELLARDVKIQVEFDARAVKAYRLLGYENRDVEDNRFRDNERDGGEIGAGHEVTAVYELVLHKRGTRGDLGTIALRWKDDDGREVSELNQPIRIATEKHRYECSPALRLALVSAKFAEKLKDTPYVRDLSYGELYEYASALNEEMPSEQTNELLDLIQRTGELNSYHSRR
ncbi:von Willebrand factor type A domain-containing protein [bacterium]|nr:von Willebrand factor type A domain-containing protein [bacterium]